MKTNTRPLALALDVLCAFLSYKTTNQNQSSFSFSLDQCSEGTLLPISIIPDIPYPSIHLDSIKKDRLINRPYFDIFLSSLRS